MALVCSTNESQPEDFEFIDCSTISVTYNSRGIASVSLSVISSRDKLLNSYINLTFGGVNFELVLNNVTVSVISGTIVFVYQLSMSGFGC